MTDPITAIATALKGKGKKKEGKKAPGSQYSYDFVSSSGCGGSC